MNAQQSEKISFVVAKLLNTVWLCCLLIFALAISSGIALALSDRHLSAVEFSQLSTVLIIAVSWLYFKPVEHLDRIRHQHNFSHLYSQDAPYLNTLQTRMAELQSCHMISQEYVFPFPYLCQIYHLLNLKHLEEVHHFSLSNLKVIKVSEFKPTQIGGAIKFQTVLESSFNTLRMWRQPIVEVDLILHSPFTVELNIPVYNDKRIIVLFNVLPLKATEHKLFIDIYSNLSWPKPAMQLLLHIASCLTVFEDLPYLRKLAERNLDRIVRLSRIPDHDTMQLFKRFTELYGST